MGFGDLRSIRLKIPVTKHESLFDAGLAGLLMLNVSRIALASFTPQPNRDVASNEADLSSVSLSGYRHGRGWVQSSETRRQRKDSVERGVTGQKVRDR